MNIRPSWAEISLDALRHNVQTLRSLTNNPFFCVMVKGNSYGHTDAIVAPFLDKLPEVSCLGVSLIEEGVRLRELGVKKNIIFFGVIQQEALPVLESFGIEPVISDWWQLNLLSSYKFHSNLKIHIKFDTGMNRLGFRLEDGQRVQNHLWELRDKFKLESILTHLPRGWDFWPSIENSFSNSQLRLLKEIWKPFARYWPDLSAHIFNSQGLIAAHATLGDEVHKWGCRLGLGIYGYCPQHPSSAPILKPVMRLCSRVVHVKKIKAGETVSYGQKWRAKRPSVIGVVPMGYADGLPRSSSHKSFVIIHGHNVPVVGNITMDNFMVDLTDLISKGQSLDSLNQSLVTIMGDSGVTASDWAIWADTIEWEILARISDRVPRIAL